mmetsp:Transcript_31533/g.57320  ORF Transcript_31533/g.57320 Transcript_31533/m.57320 type:complete len:426 (+) Transcript_31533:151-1428(+)
MRVAGIKVSSPSEAKRVRWILGVHAGAAACGGVSLAWLVTLILFTSHEGECGGYEVQHDENLGKWHTSLSDAFSIGFVCERTAELGCLASWSRFEESCYTMICESSSYDEAVEGCRKRGALLVSVNSELENRFVQELCGRQSCWIGLERPPGSAMWQWADGTVLGLWDNWTAFSNYDEDIESNRDKTCLNKGPPERFIEEPAFIIKAVGKFVVPSCLMFLAYLALKRRSNDLTQCLCIVDGFFAACLFAEMVIMIFRLMKGGPWYDVVAYVLFLAVASCGVAFCCACSVKALSSLQAQLKAAELSDKSAEETAAMMGPEPKEVEEIKQSLPAVKYTSKAQNLVSVPENHMAAVSERHQSHQVALEVREGQPSWQGQPMEKHAHTSVPPQALGNADPDDDFAIADECMDDDPEPLEPRPSKPTVSM